jgi:DNA polymerase III alpha subunit
MATKNSIKDVARVEKVPIAESNRLCKAIPDRLPDGPDGKATKMNLPNAIKYVKELQEAGEADYLATTTTDTITFSKPRKAKED